VIIVMYSSERKLKRNSLSTAVAKVKQLPMLSAHNVLKKCPVLVQSAQDALHGAVKTTMSSDELTLMLMLREISVG